MDNTGSKYDRRLSLQVLTLLRDAASCVESETSQHLVRDAIRLLSSQELYAPSITRWVAPPPSGHMKRTAASPLPMLEPPLLVLQSPDEESLHCRFRDNDRIATQYYDGLVRVRLCLLPCPFFPSESCLA